MSTNKRQIGGSHYLDMGVQPWDVIATWPRAEQIGFFKGSALAYIMRAGRKGPAATDLEKAAHYLEKLIEVEDQPE